MNSFTNIRGLWGFLGVSLSLVALYLVLTNYTGAQTVIDSLGRNTIDFYATLQGRGPGR